MRILHTSDWHLGRTLYAKKDRQAEHSLFFDWLLATIQNEKIDLLLMAGDVFDTASPSNTSQNMYYDFLMRVRAAGCENAIIVGGNHDSPSFLNAPKPLLKAMKVSVIGSATENLSDEIIVLNDKSGNPKLIVCAVPFLRERDISRFVEAESYGDRSKRVNESIKNHYAQIAELAEAKRQELGVEIPIVATGHLSVMGGKRNEDDGVRDTYIGSIEAVGSDIFPDAFDYVALGHYHIPSKIKEHIRYCGSPIAMGFGEAGQQKCVYVVDFDADEKFKTIHIPTFQIMESIVGNQEFIEQRLSELKQLNQSVWVEITYDDNRVFSDLSAWVHSQIADTQIEVLKVQNKQFLNEVLTREDFEVDLKEMNNQAVFEKLLDKNEVSADQRNELLAMYQEIVDEINLED